MNIVKSCKDLTQHLAASTARYLGGRRSPLEVSIPEPGMPALSAVAYERAVRRCRLTHKFFFLALPIPVRMLIYTEFFLGNTVEVCSWLKTHQGPFAAQERCQMLMTCSTIHREAIPYFYYFSRWRFNSMATLQYFTWPTGGYRHCCSSIAKLTFTESDTLHEFSKHIAKFRQLQFITLDVASEFKVFTMRRPTNRVEREAFINSLVSRGYYRDRCHPYLYIQRTWDVYMTVDVTYDNGYREVLQLPYAFKYVVS